MRLIIACGISLPHDLTGVVDGVGHAEVAAERSQVAHRAAAADERAKRPGRKIRVSHHLISAVDASCAAVPSPQGPEIRHALSGPQERVLLARRCTLHARWSWPWKGAGVDLAPPARARGRP